MPVPRRRFVYSTLICGTITGVLLCNFVFRDSVHPWRVQTGPDIEASSPPTCNLECEDRGSPPPVTAPVSALDPLDPLASLNGPPTLSYKANLRSGSKYITSWGSSAGWTNDVITFINLVYLGLITDRVAILPVFMSTHLPGNAPALHFGEVFDLPRLRRALGKPVLEWREVKQPNSPILDDIGCWNIWESVQYRENAPRHSNVPWKLNLDISYTKTPYWIKMIPNFEHDQFSTFWSLAALAFPAARAANLVTPLPSPQHRLSLPPDEHLLCYDFLYYVAAQEPFEIGLDYSPAWRYVGQYMRWTAALEHLAETYVRKALRVDAHDPIPPFIAVHARRDDFQGWCGDYTTEECFASLYVIARRVQEVKAELWHRKGIITNNIIITSDEQDKMWWAQVAALGWRTPDHSHTEETYGAWYSVLIDSVILSQAAGFVGTDRSTMSILAARRVDSWREGAVRFVLWGRPGADDHDEY
ncbi:hypothetical protein B0H17DRAFT_956880 [Mycena rosella]|uniref:GDP-fucose protein O-fucosyltransferase 2 n=1 Tax=Mycena rosella TaxID=1033263 RepID=A0AAD7G4K3_MYCRO|nr:hypothetical protein B0H17DRAFT_956880 [Mycena rosella]